MGYGVFMRDTLGSAGVGVLLVFGIIDYLWGEFVFACPCGNSLSDRQVFSVALVMVPCLVLLFWDVNWKLCISLPRAQNYVIIRILMRPLVLILMWIGFALFEKKIQTCFNEVKPCTCNEEEKNCSVSRKEEVSFKIALAAKILLGIASFLAVAILFTALVLVRQRSKKSSCCGRRCNVSEWDCFCTCVNASQAKQTGDAVTILRGGGKDGDEDREHVVEMSTIFTLAEQGLLKTTQNNTFKKISNYAMKKLTDKLTVNEYERLDAFNDALENSENEAAGQPKRQSTTATTKNRKSTTADDKDPLYPSVTFDEMSVV